MITRRTLWPGDPGTKKIVEQFGKDLICVRYRYDAVRRKCYKTVELIFETHEWIPDNSRIPPNKIVSIKTRPDEITLHTVIRQHGGKWNTLKRVWKLKYETVKKLNLESRIVRSF